MANKMLDKFLKCSTYSRINNRCLHMVNLNKNNFFVRRQPLLGIVRLKSQNNSNSPFVPIPLKITSNPDDINIGEELSTRLKKDDLLNILNQFIKRPIIKELSEENGLEVRLFHQAFISFRKFCMESEILPADLHITFSDILQGAGHVDDLFPYFLQHARQIFPHLECMEELKKISDLRLPAHWYPEARAINRKIIFHAGPTNSGKTYHALERFSIAKSGVYCGPLKLLAVEVFHKTNEKGTPCDLITGEERCYVNKEENPSTHVSCTVEMASVTAPYEVAVIDEIQMIRDMGRGWAWTRALLGVAANEIHVCGEEAAIDLVKEIVATVGEEVEVRRYKRLTKLTIEDSALNKLDNVRPGDCIVCFSKNDIYNVSLQIEKRGHECAVIYGGLPPGTKLAQAKKFNDPNDDCKILVATDAIGMGLNLSIRRIIFYSIIKPIINEKGEKEMDTITTSQALQIAGRAGRYGTQFEEGFVTTFRGEDLPILKEILSREVELITAAGLHPTAEQIELFAYHLPHATLSNLTDIFVSLCQVDTSSYFMCNIEDFKFLADMIQHVPLPLRARYVFCCSPINKKLPFVCTMFLKFARQYSGNVPLTFDWLCRNIGWPFSPPKTILELLHLESVFDVLDLYLWLSYRFMDLFPDVNMVRDLQTELDKIIQEGVRNITHLLRSGNMSHEIEEDYHIPKGKVGNIKMQNDNDDLKVSKDADFVGHGRLTDRLIAQGLLTPKMLDQLKKELNESGEEQLSTAKRKKPSVTRRPKK